jgi:DNA invertase Pin-like site-specific DNA recombinase
MSGNSLHQASTSAHKIFPRHLDRLAVVYIRQSTQHQVDNNRESTELQYQLRRRAVGLGWADERVVIIDDDQGISGQSVENRPGFQRLLAEVSLGHIGIVFGREMSRLARSCKDWHHLLELCGIFQVLIADADGVYDPTDPNDRMLLGLRGMMSEAELHVLRSRLHQGKLNKARRGELFSCVPIGYVRSPEGGIALDPDEQVRSVVSLVFQKYTELGSLPKTHRFLIAHDIRLGLRVYKGPGKGRLMWQRPRRSTLYQMLRHPFYAGAYVYGRCPLDPSRRAAGKKPGRRIAPPEEWTCLLRDKVPAYIAWDEHQENLRRLAANDRGRGSKAVPGGAPTLLNGIVRCGHCQRPMKVANARRTAHPRYVCDHEFMEYGGARCQSLTAAYPDRLIEQLVLQTVEPAALELSLRATEQIEQNQIQLHAHWKQRLERAEYETSRARRQYDAVEPENRLVARELERQWQQRLSERQQLEEDYARFQSETPQQLADADRERIRRLTADLPALWQAETTTGAERRAVVRLLIEYVELTRCGETERVAVAVHWRGGTVTRHDITQGLRRYTALGRYAALRERVIGLRGEGFTADQIAVTLNHEGYTVPRGEQFTGHRVRQLFVRFGLAGLPPGIRDQRDLPGQDEWWLPALAAELKIPPIVAHRWRWSGWLSARQLCSSHGRWIVHADQAEIQRLRELRAFEIQHHSRQRPPLELTTPRLPRSAIQLTTRAHRGGK